MKAATLLLAAALLYACGGSRHRVTVEAVADDCVQVLYFHGKQRCATCTAIERLTREVIDSIGSEKWSFGSSTSPRTKPWPTDTKPGGRR